jgi:hypothetical protein
MNEQFQNLVDTLAHRGTRLLVAPVALSALERIRAELSRTGSDFLFVRTGVASGFAISDQVCLSRATGTAAESMTIAGLVDLLAEAVEAPELSHNWRRLLGPAGNASRFATAKSPARNGMAGPHRGKRLL